MPKETTPTVTRDDFEKMSGDLTRAKNLLVRLWDKHPAARAQIEASTGPWFVWGQDRDAQSPAANEAPSKPFAYYIYIAAEQRAEFVYKLDEALDDLTNYECKITELFDHATPAPAAPASVQTVQASLSDEQRETLLDAAYEWSLYVTADDAPRTLHAHMMAAIDALPSTPTQAGQTTTKESDHG